MDRNKGMRSAREKIRQAIEIESVVRQSGQKMVFTNGCFDILHLGHTRYLEEAKKLGDILVVGINSDESVKRTKGAGRPINTENDRTEIVASLESVDYVTIFNEDTPIELIKVLKPDIHVKGGDYSEEELPEAEAVHSYGGSVVVLSEVEGKSTSALISSICRRGESDV